MSLAFHEIKNDEVEEVLAQGLRLGRKGHKRDKEINRTDDFLNEQRPSHTINHGIDRKTNIYCYLSSGNDAIDIATGSKKYPSEIISNPQQSLLKVNVDPEKCYVSNLDLYDRIKALLHSNKISEAEGLARTYWEALLPLAKYKSNFRRPELMVTYDISPTDISKEI